MRSLSARNPRSARVWAAVALMATIVTNLGAGVLADGRLHTHNVVAFAVLTLGTALLLRSPADRVAPFVGLAPLTGVATIVWLDLLSADAGVTGQVFFIAPVIWAAAQLRVGGALVVTSATLVGEAVVVGRFLEPERAVTDFAYVAVLLVLICGVLSRAGTNQERLVERLREQAGVDALTGLSTRRVLDAATDRAVAGGRVCLVIIDLDRFKTINDTHGHLGGDAALTHVADLLTARCRDRDVVARMGGDELAVLMVDCPLDIASYRAQQFVDAVRENPLRLPDGTLVPLSISAGLAEAATDRAQDLYARADAALYAAKRAGRDRLAAA